ncbi:MAG: dephospho-CoA kinase [Steroidobacteraceae bacterium]|jgi:dephospho-CoA kinase
MARQLRIGLTGGIASGKSTVARRFRELGVPVIDADEVARTVVALGQPGLNQVVERFGPGILSPSGEINRRALRDRVFADADSRKDLEAILHPRIRAEMARLAEAASGPYLVMAIPLLVEGGSHADLDRILVVDLDEATQLARLMERDGSSESQARAMLAAQASRAERLARADDILDNSGSVEQLRDSVDRLHVRYRGIAAGLPS